MNVLGIDIGGANLKAALTNGAARSLPFALWKQPQELPRALRELTQKWSWDRLAITMTGELCDCFETKRLGVLSILDATEQVFGDAMVWRNDGTFVTLAEAKKNPIPCAAANWLALATFVGSYCAEGDGMLLDIGSTTTDIIPLRDGRPIPRGRTDTERLRSGELVYVGMRRTPVCSLLGVEGMAEFFATTCDVGLILGDIAENELDCDTADQRPATRKHAYARMARMIGGDCESMTPTEIDELARIIRQRQQIAILAGYVRVCSTVRPRCLILSGAGEPLGRQVAPHGLSVVSLNEKLGPDISSAACAYALTQII